MRENAAKAQRTADALQNGVIDTFTKEDAPVWVAIEIARGR
jgi:hypothetical protein